MSSMPDWKVPSAAQPRPENYAFDLDRALSAIVGVHAMIPSDAFTAETLGTERAGNGVHIGDGLVLTIGYLVTEATAVWLHLGHGTAVEGHLLGYDQETGFGLVQVLGHIDLPALPIGSSAALAPGDNVVMGGSGGRSRSVAARVVGKQEFAGHWEYALEEAIFTYPSHPNWGGAGLISPNGELVGIGSLQIERSTEGKSEHLNMVVPIDLLKPILDDLRKFGRVNKPVRPWLGIYSTEVEGKVVVAGLSSRGPASRAELKLGDVIVAVGGKRVSTLMDFYRRLWSLGAAGVKVPLTIYREGDTFEITVTSSDRARMMKKPQLH